MRMPVCAQPGVASSTTLSQPSRPIAPRRWNQFPSSVMASPARIRCSAVLGEAEVDAAVEGGVEPATGDRLLAGEEVEAMDTVRLRVAEQRCLPPAERVVRDGTGMGTLMPIIPTWTSCWKRRAAPPSLVKIAVPLPNRPELIRSTPSWKVCTRTTDSTGPKISSWYAREEVGISSMSVGPNQKPSSFPSTVNPLPSTTMRAPSASAMST